MNANTGSNAHTAPFNQNKPVVLMIPKIVSGGKCSAPSGKQVPARKVPMNSTLPANYPVTSSRALMNGGMEHGVRMRGGIGTGVDIEGGEGEGGGGRMSGKGIGMGTGVLMRNFCPRSSEVSRAVEGLPHNHRVRAPKMPLQKTNSNDNNAGSGRCNIVNNDNDKRHVIDLLESKLPHLVPVAVPHPPPSYTSTVPAPNVVPVPVPPFAAGTPYIAKATDKYSASAFLQLESDEDW